MTQLFDCRDAFASALQEIAEQQTNVVTVVNDSVGSSKVNQFAKTFPTRLVNVGIAEQDMIGIAAGLANGGMLPFVCGAACFMTGRALEQIKADLAYSNVNVKLCGMSSGMAYGELGPTHHSIEDIAWTRAIANMTVVVPADPIETKQAMFAAAKFQGPMFIRISRMGVPNVHPEDYQFEIGRAAQLRDGNDVTLIANGTVVCRALDAAKLLDQQGIQARVLNMATVRPIDRDAIVRAAKETRGIVTVEEHTTYGGLGSAVAEVVVQSAPVPMRLLGVPGVFAPTGSPEFLLDYFGMTPQNIATAAQELLTPSA
jgi:transketolase